MSGRPLFWKHIPSLRTCTFWREAHAASSNDIQYGPTLPCHGGKGRGKKRTYPLWLKGTEVSPSQAWPVEHCTVWCINICLWLKFKQPCVAARHNRKPTSKGKCLLQWGPKEQVPAKDHIWLARHVCGVIIKHLATGRWGVPTLLVMVMFFNAQPCHS